MAAAAAKKRVNSPTEMQMPPKNFDEGQEDAERDRGVGHGAAAEDLAPAVDDEMHAAGDADDRPAQRNDKFVEAPQERQDRFRFTPDLGHLSPPRPVAGRLSRVRFAKAPGEPSQGRRRKPTR